MADFWAGLLIFLEETCGVKDAFMSCARPEIVQDRFVVFEIMVNKTHKSIKVIF